MSFASLRDRLRNLPLWRRRRRSEHLRLGRRGERLAARALRRKRHCLLARNYRCPAGEIDLITADGDEVVFVEVKTRTSDESQDLSETISPAKWRRVERAARYYLRGQASADRACRFDMVTVFRPERGRVQVEHVVNAYTPRNP